MRTGVSGVPDFEQHVFSEKKANYCMLIPVINEGDRIKAELERARRNAVDRLCDIVIVDGGSRDGSVARSVVEPLGVNTLLIKRGEGKQGAQLRMGFFWALERGYDGFITVDGNNKDSVESAALFVEKLDAGYDFIQGSRFIDGGQAINTPLTRHLAVKLLHAPVISATAGFRFTDTTNAFRGYSRRYIDNPDVDIFRDVFWGYELLAYLSVRASQLGLRVCEVPVTRAYPKHEKTPTKIHPLKGNVDLIRILFNNKRGVYAPKDGGREKG